MTTPTTDTDKLTELAPLPWRLIEDGDYIRLEDANHRMITCFTFAGVTRQEQRDCGRLFLRWVYQQSLGLGEGVEVPSVEELRRVYDNAMAGPSGMSYGIAAVREAMLKVMRTEGQYTTDVCATLRSERDEANARAESAELNESHWKAKVEAAEGRCAGMSDGNPWHKAIDEELVTTFVLSDKNKDDPKQALNDIIQWHIQVATDEKVNGGYRLVKVGDGGSESSACFAEVASAEIERLRNCLKEIGGVLDADCDPQAMARAALSTPSAGGVKEGTRSLKEGEVMHPDSLEKHLLMAERDTLKAKLAAAEKERDELAQWKESAMSVSPPLQEIARELGVGLGQSIHDKILPGIRELKRRLGENPCQP